jgi:hypothetical protein
VTRQRKSTPIRQKKGAAALLFCFFFLWARSTEAPRKQRRCLSTLQQPPARTWFVNSDHTVSGPQQVFSARAKALFGGFGARRRLLWWCVVGGAPRQQERLTDAGEVRFRYPFRGLGRRSVVDILLTKQQLFRTRPSRGPVNQSRIEDRPKRPSW